jgi:hypothetical protein
MCRYYPSWMWSNATNETLPTNVNASVKKCGFDHDLCDWTSDVWTQDALTYLRLQASRRQRTLSPSPGTDTSVIADPENVGRRRDEMAPQPFFLMVSYTSPHAGSISSIDENDVPVPRVSTGPYANQTTWPQVEIDFATAITWQDMQVECFCECAQVFTFMHACISFTRPVHASHIA